VQVAVSGVEHVGHPQPIALAERGDLLEHARDLAARDDAVLHQVIAGDAAHGGEGALAPLPHQLPLRGVLRHADLQRARLARQLDGVRGGVVAFVGHPIDVHQECRPTSGQSTPVAALAATMASVSIISIAAGTIPER